MCIAGYVPNFVFLFCINKNFLANLDDLRTVKSREFFPCIYVSIIRYIEQFPFCIKHITIMSSELELLRQHITELEAENNKLEAENAELRKENTEICNLRIKLLVSDAEIVELKYRNSF